MNNDIKNQIMDKILLIENSLKSESDIIIKFDKKSNTIKILENKVKRL